MSQTSTGLTYRFYRRFDRSYTELMIAVGGGALYALSVIHLAVVSLFLGLTTNQAVRVSVQALALISAVSAVALVVLVRTFEPARRWQRGERGPEVASEAWIAVVARLPRIIGAIDVAVAVVLLPIAVRAAALAELSAFGALMLVLFGSVMTFGGGILVYLLIEQLMRPLVRDIAIELPPGFASPARTVSLSAKLLGLLLAINVYTAMLIAGLANTSFSREARIALAALISLTIPLLLTLLVRRSLVLRLQDLQQAFERVRDRDLSAHLPNIAGDELDEVGSRFNVMVAGLREREGLQDELRASRARIVAAGDASRRAVERDLHDGAQQHLVLLKLKLGLLERTAAADPAAAQPMFADVRDQLDRALSELRDLAHGIYPPALTNNGLRYALEEAAARAPVPVTVECADIGRYPAELEAAVYFCCVEALQNAAKHAGKDASARLTIENEDQHLRFEVADDGAGFDAAAANGSSGLQNMADRLGALGGTVQIISSPGGGTRVVGRVPSVTVAAGG